MVQVGTSQSWEGAAVVGKAHTFAAKLEALREAAGISQYRLAQLSGLTKQTLSRLEMGAAQPSWETVQLLAAALDVECTVFLDPGLTLPAAPPPAWRGRRPKAPKARDQKRSDRERKRT
jgi:transcriptional regulator with XRE-family HTH domain